MQDIAAQIDWAHYIDMVVAALAALLVAALSAAALALKNWANSQRGVNDNAILNEAIGIGIAWARATGDDEDALIPRAASYARTGAGGAMHRLGVSDARLQEMIRARLSPDPIAAVPGGAAVSNQAAEGDPR